MSEIEATVPDTPVIPQGLSEAASRRLREWLCDKAYRAMREQTLALVQAAHADSEGLSALEDAFCRDLPIGTGGRRGQVGPGPNRMKSF